MLRILIAVLVVVLLVIFVYLQSKGFVVEHYEFESDVLLDDFHFVFMSDLHEVQYGEKNELLIETILKQAPECVLIGGDMITCNKNVDQQFEDILLFLEKLSKVIPVYYVPGNHERALFDLRDNGRKTRNPSKSTEDIERITRLENTLKENNIPLLRNASIKLHNDQVVVYGLDLSLDYFRRIVRYAPEDDCIVNLLGEPGNDCYNIMMAHDPEHFVEYSKWGCDLVLSGHLHGGIVRIPGLGGVISPQLRLFPKYDSGVFREGNSSMLLTRGIGTHSVPIRIFNKAEICDVVIHRK